MAVLTALAERRQSEAERARLAAAAIGEQGREARPRATPARAEALDERSLLDERPGVRPQLRTRRRERPRLRPVLRARQRRLDACEDVGHNPEFPAEGILFKDSEVWETAHKELTKVIADREAEKGTVRRTGKASKRNQRR